HADPHKYLTGSGPKTMEPQTSEVLGLRKFTSPAAPGTRTKYICPMDREAKSDRPGPCPRGARALEPPGAPAAEEASPELKDMARRFWISLILGLPIFVLSMGEMLLGREILPRSVSEGVQALLATVIVVYGGGLFFARAWTSLVQRSPNMFTL